MNIWPTKPENLDTFLKSLNHSQIILFTYGACFLACYKKENYCC